MKQRLISRLGPFGPFYPFNPSKSSSRSNNRLLTSLLILLILSTSALLGACRATPPEEVEMPVPEPSAEAALEEALYDLMAAGAELDVVTDAWLKALEAAGDDQVKDRLTSRWFDHAKYKTSVLSRALYSEDGDTKDAEGAISPLFEIYNTLFERQWDAAKIKDIEDPELRRYFEVLDQSYMRMVEYGEYVGPGFDFDRLSNLSALADGFKTYFSLSASYYGFLTEVYQTGLLPYNAFVDYTLKVEEALEASTSPYQTVYLEPLLRWSYGMLFSGTMGSGPFNYETNTLNPEFEDVLKGVIDRAPDSGLAELASKVIDLPDGSDASEYAYVDAVQNFRRFGFDSPKGIRAIYNYKHPTFYESRPELFGFEDLEIMATLEGNINAAMEQLKEKVAWGQNPKASYNLGFYLEFANTRWASFQLAASSFDPETEVNVNFNEPAVFDLTTGKRVTLDEFLGDPSGAAADKLEAILVEQANQYMELPSAVQVDMSQRFSLGEDYILAMLPPKSLSEAQAYDLFVDVRYGLAFPEVDVRARLLP